VQASAPPSRCEKRAGDREGFPSVVRGPGLTAGGAAFAWNRWQLCRGISGSFHLESVAGLSWNQWQLSGGTSGSFGVESVAGFPWNRWQLWRGIRTQARDTWWADTIGRIARHRDVLGLPSEKPFTPGTFDPEIVMTRLRELGSGLFAHRNVPHRHVSVVHRADDVGCLNVGGNAAQTCGCSAAGRSCPPLVPSSVGE
jgi:hypothetical protein